MLTSKDVDYVTKYYSNHHQVVLDDPLVSPTFGNLKRLAPAFVVTAGHDLLHDEGKIYSHKLRQSGVKVEYVDYPDQTHGFINLTPVSSKAKRIPLRLQRTLESFGIITINLIKPMFHVEHRFSFQITNKK